MVKVFIISGCWLIVIGDGFQFDELWVMVGFNIEFIGKLSSFQVVEILSWVCGYFVMVEEDFGIVNVEVFVFGILVIVWG